MVTGESMPITKEPGAKLIGGTINQTGGLVMRAEKIGRDTMLARIVQMVAEAQRSRAPIQRLADTVSGWFVPAVIAVAAIAFVAWSLVGPSPAMGYGLIAAVAVLIIACPCALGLATPMSIMVGVGRGAQAGILIKNAEALERMEKGRYACRRQDRNAHRRQACGGRRSRRRKGSTAKRCCALPPASSAAASIRWPWRWSGMPKPRGSQSANRATSISQSARGSPASSMDIGLLLAMPAFLKNKGLDCPIWRNVPTPCALTGRPQFSWGRWQGCRPSALPIRSSRLRLRCIKALAEAGIHVIMLTGDNRVTAEAIARRLGIDDIEADVLPDQKSAIVKRLRDEGRIVAMAGDGVNDAPALAAADVGIAMGTGTDVAIESAGVTLLKGDLTGIARARHLSHATMTNIRQNLFFAFAYNVAGIPVAAGALYPLFGIMLSPIIAAAAMALSSVSVIGIRCVSGGLRTMNLPASERGCWPRLRLR
jgi:Cu+-exporting ATPase